MKKIILALLCSVLLALPVSAGVTPWRVYSMKIPQDFVIDKEITFTVDDVWSGYGFVGGDSTKNYVFSTSDNRESFVVHILYYSGEINEEDYFGSIIKTALADSTDEPTIKYYDLNGHTTKCYVFTTNGQTSYVDYSINTGHSIVDFLYCVDVGYEGSGKESFFNVIVPSIQITSNDSTTTTTTPSIDEKSLIRSSISSHVNTTYDNTVVDDITINDDYGTGSGFIALVYLTWNVQNSAQTTKEMLKMYSDDLAATIADKYTSVNEIAIFWKVPYLTDKTSKWSYTCRDGGAYLSDNIVSFE